MYIGYLTIKKKPNDLEELIAIASKYKGISFVYLTPEDIIPENETISGKMLLGNKWEKVIVPWPIFIDISQKSFGKLSKKQINFLRENIELSDNGLNRLKKIKLQNLLNKDKNYKNLVIPTKEIKNLEDMYEFLNEYNQVVLKPNSGQFGKGVFSITIENTSFLVKSEKKVERLNKEDLKAFYINNIEEKNYIVQKFINSQTDQGYPFDCRINVEKDGNGRWTVARMFFRLGVGQKVVSNISQGGGVSDITPFLNANFPNQQKEIKLELENVAKTLPYKIEELREIKLVKLGIDLGIDSNGKVYLFEVNGSPGTTQLRDRVALLRTDFYQYILKKNERGD